MKSNPILKLLKEGDIVFMEVPSFLFTVKQIIKLKNLKYEPVDDQFKFDWLNFDPEVLYTNMRWHPSLLGRCAGNCLAIKEIVPTAILEMFAANHNMWKATDNMLSDEELAAEQERLKNQFEDFQKYNF